MRRLVGAAHLWCVARRPAGLLEAGGRARLRSRRLKQDQHRPRAAGMVRRFAIGEHVVALRQPAPHLALEHRLAVGRGKPLAVDDTHAAPAAVRAPRSGSRRARRALRRDCAGAGRVPPAPTSDRAAAGRARRCRVPCAEKSARLRPPGRRPSAEGEGSTPCLLAARASASSARRCAGRVGGSRARPGGAIGGAQRRDVGEHRAQVDLGFRLARRRAWHRTRGRRRFASGRPSWRSRAAP